MGTDRGRYGSAAVSVRENRRKTSLLQSGRCVLLASANTWRVRFRRIIVNQRPPRDTRLCHTRYPSVRQYGNVMCHTVMALTWIGPRPVGCECDHINGNIYDWRAENLQWVTPAENRKRAVILRARRMVARQDNDPSKDPKNMKPEELLALFNAYNVAGDVYAGE